MTDQKYEQMYDEHRPPRAGIERELMEILGTCTKHQGRDVVDELKKHGHSEQEARECIWFLIDRGYVEFTFDRKLIGHPEPISPAPCDFL